MVIDIQEEPSLKDWLFLRIGEGARDLIVDANKIYLSCLK
jgi:hypothetical protein